MTPWWDDTEPDDDYDERREINAGELARRRGRCDWCGNNPCTCDSALFDADELGLDPEEDDERA